MNQRRRIIDGMCDILDVVGRLADDFFAIAGQLARIAGQAVRFLCPVGNMVDADRHFLDGRRHARSCFTLLVRGRGHLARGRRHSIGRGRHRSRTFGDGLEVPLHLVEQLVERVPGQAQFVEAGDRNSRREVECLVHLSHQSA